MRWKKTGLRYLNNLLSVSNLTLPDFMITQISSGILNSINSIIKLKILVRSTPPSRPNVRLLVHPQKVSSISMKFGM